MAVPNMIVTLVANTTKYASGLRKASKDTMSFGKVAQMGFTAARTAVLGMGVALVKIIPALANMGAESRKADIQLKFMLENMQGISAATNGTVKRMAEYAKRVSIATGIDDESVKAVQKKILVFKSLRKTADDLGGTFDRATKAALDLAVAGFGDAEANAIKLGRVLEDPIRNMNALSRAGITFTAEEKKKIAALVESGKLLQAQDIILKSIEKRVGGLAEASATPFDKMVQQFQEMGDTIGEAILPELESMNKEISKWLSSPQGKKDLKDTIDGFVTIARAMKEASNFVRDVKKVLDSITKSNKWFFDGLRMWADANIPGQNTFNSGNKSAPGGSTKPTTARSTTVNVTGITPSATIGKTVISAVKTAERLGAR